MRFKLVPEKGKFEQDNYHSKQDKNKDFEWLVK